MSDSLNSPSEPRSASPCRHLRNKGMYVYTDGADNSHPDYDNTIFWCLKTMKSLGPDEEVADREECCNPERSCYQPT